LSVLRQQQILIFGALILFVEHQKVYLFESLFIIFIKRFSAY